MGAGGGAHSAASGREGSLRRGVGQEVAWCFQVATCGLARVQSWWEVPGEEDLPRRPKGKGLERTLAGQQHQSMEALEQSASSALLFRSWEGVTKLGFIQQTVLAVPK